MIAVAQLAATQPRFAHVQNEFRALRHRHRRRLGAQRTGTGLRAGADPEHTAAAIALLFENFTTVFVGSSGLGSDQRRGRHRDAVDDLEEDAVRVLTTTAHTRATKEITVDFALPEHLPPCSPRWTRSSRRRSSRWNARTCSTSTSVASTPAPTGTTAASRDREWEDLLGEMRRRADAAGWLRYGLPVVVRRPRRHQPRHGGDPGTPGAQGTRPAQRPAGRVVDRRQLPAGDHDGPVRHRDAAARSGRRP